MSAERSEAPASTADREIVMTRLLDAPPELVFEAWTRPEHLVNWWGPDGFTITIHEIDVRPGGVWHFIMHGPDGRDYNNKNIFVEVDRPRRLVYDHVTGPVHHVTVTFENQDGKTKLTMRSLFDTVRDRDYAVETFGAIEGAKQHVGRLAEYVTKVLPSS